MRRVVLVIAVAVLLFALIVDISTSKIPWHQRQQIENLYGKVKNTAATCLNELSNQTKTEITNGLAKLNNDLKIFYANTTEENKQIIFTDLRYLDSAARRAMNEMSESDKCQESFGDMLNTTIKIEQEIETIIA